MRLRLVIIVLRLVRIICPILRVVILLVSMVLLLWRVMRRLYRKVWLFVLSLLTIRLCSVRLIIMVTCLMLVL